jgi:hypothetical protein
MSLSRILIPAIILFSFATIIYAGTTFPLIVPMNESSYTHNKKIVQFNHKKHVSAYKLKCGECHHDKSGIPVILKHGDNVDRCIKCHSKPGEIKGKKAKGMSKTEKRRYHANALHDKCRGCHKALKKSNKSKNAPTSCRKCHKK